MRRFPLRDRREGSVGVTAADNADTLIADKTFDADAHVLEPLAVAGKTAVIPPRTNRSSPREYDGQLGSSMARAI